MNRFERIIENYGLRWTCGIDINGYREVKTEVSKTVKEKKQGKVEDKMWEEKKKEIAEKIINFQHRSLEIFDIQKFTEKNEKSLLIEEIPSDILPFCTILNSAFENEYQLFKEIKRMGVPLEENQIFKEGKGEKLIKKIEQNFGEEEKMLHVFNFEEKEKAIRKNLVIFTREAVSEVKKSKAMEKLEKEIEEEIETWFQIQINN